MYWLVDKDTEELLMLVPEQRLNVITENKYQALLEVPEGIAPGNCKVLNTDGVLSLIDGSADKAGPLWNKLRTERNQKLLACDWTRLDDNGLSNEVKTAWATYRQALRDLPQNTTDPEQITWPTEP
jgi:hypothetical protein